MKSTPAVVVPNEVRPVPSKDHREESTCDCDDEVGYDQSKVSENEAEQFIAFENELHNTIYVK